MPKKSPCIWATLWETMSPRTFKNRPIWSHWINNSHLLTKKYSFVDLLFVRFISFLYFWISLQEIVLKPNNILFQNLLQIVKRSNIFSRERWTGWPWGVGDSETVVDAIKLFFDEIFKNLVSPLDETIRILGHFKSNKQFKSKVLLKIELC